MNHIEVTIPTTDTELQEMLIAMLAEIGYDGFEENEEQLKAFIDESKFDENILAVITSQLNLTFSKQTIAKQNWNELWESNFSTVIVDDFVGIRAHFHEPLKGVQHEIIITPKMSFGTGHHATTFSVMKLMKDIDFSNKSVFDFGTGTGILAILAEKLGANDILAVDNDDWCIENSIENAANNNCQNIKIELANDAKTGRQFDVVIANINKNIILDNLQDLAADVASNGNIIVSGLLREDEADILAATAGIGWKHITTLRRDAWIAIHLKQ
jgi:ribosomal protein L11 methyltransferase